MALKPWPRPVMEFVKFKNKQVAGLYVDDYPYVVIIKVDGVKKTASGDLGKLMTQQDWNRIFTELTGERNVVAAASKYQFKVTGSFIIGGGNKFARIRLGDIPNPSRFKTYSVPNPE